MSTRRILNITSRKKVDNMLPVVVAEDSTESVGPYSSVSPSFAFLFPTLGLPEPLSQILPSAMPPIFSPLVTRRKSKSTSRWWNLYVEAHSLHAQG